MSAIDIRPAELADWPEVVALLRMTLNAGDDPRYDDFLRWKHRDNPFGESLAWVAVVDGRIAGYRAFLQWRFVGAGGPVRAVRAVDTATHPAHQGQGIFRSLTMAAVEEMTASGVGFVFNTPNDQSRPGYLKMGWRFLGRVPVRVRPALPPRIRRLASARAAAARFGPAPAGFGPVDPGALAASVAGDELHTDRSDDFVAWRYRFDPLNYRMASGLDGSTAVFRLRPRGDALEATFSELVAGRHPAALVASVLRATRADLATLPDDSGVWWAPRVTRLAPTLCVRDLAATAPQHLDDLALSLGDLELF